MYKSWGSESLTRRSWRFLDCELAVREKKGTKYLFVLNYGKDPAEIVLKTGLRELLAGEIRYGAQVLEPYGVRIYKIDI